MTQPARVLTLTVLWACSACTGTDVGNPVVDVDFALYNEDFEDQGTAAQPAPGETISVTDAWVSVDRVRLRDAANCDGNAEVELTGPFAVDMLAPGAIPELSGLAVPPLGYCRFELRWDALDGAPPAGAPSELAGASIFVAGARGDGTPFIVRSDRNDELRLDAIGGAFDVSDTTHALFVGFDGARLFAGVDLDGATVDGTGVIRIEPGSNDDQLQAFDDNVADATELFDDDDDDGLLDPDERDAADILAD